MRLFLLAILTLPNLSSTKKPEEFVGPPFCPVNYYGDKTTVRCYGFPQGNPKDTLTWVEAEKACRKQGGLLAILAAAPDGGKVLKFLRGEAVKHNIHGAWVAANDGPSKNAFTWMDGSPLSESGHLKFYTKYPEPHAGPSCIWLTFNAKENDVLVRNQHCNTEKKQYICHMPLYLPDEEGATTKKHHPATKAPVHHPVPMKSKEVPPAKGHHPAPPKIKEPPPPKGKAAPMGEIRALMPSDLPGASAILSISADKLIAERSDKITDMYGSPIMTDEEMEKLIPPELYKANMSDTAISSAKALLMEITGDYFQRYRRGNTTEIAKYLTAYLLEEGRSIRCIYGVNQLQRQVECLPANGIIESCAKTITMDGIVARECGLPGLKLLGCHNTVRGVTCFCENDLCNDARSSLKTTKILLLPGLIAAFLHILL